MRSPGSVEVLRLEEALEACVVAVEIRGLVCSEEVLPVLRPSLVLFGIAGFVHGPSHLGDSEVIVRVFQCAGNAAS